MIARRARPVRPNSNNADPRRPRFRVGRRYTPAPPGCPRAFGDLADVHRSACLGIPIPVRCRHASEPLALGSGDLRRRGVGRRLLRDRRPGHRAGPSRPRSGPADRPARSRQRTAGAGLRDAGAAALRRPARDRHGRSSPGFRRGDRLQRIPGRLRRGVPGEGQPAAGRGRGREPTGSRTRLRTRSGLEARTARGPRPHRRSARPAHRLQRLQGGSLHRVRDARRQARPGDRAGGREPRRTAPRAGAGAEVRRPPEDRGPGQSQHPGRRPLGGIERHPGQVRSHPRRGARDRGAAPRAEHARLSRTAALPHGKPDARHPAGRRRRRRTRPDLLRTATARGGCAVPRRRRRTRHRLRRQSDQLPLQPQLLAGRVRRQRGPPRAVDLRRGGGAASDDRHRERPGDGRPAERAGLRRARGEHLRAARPSRDRRSRRGRSSISTTRGRDSRPRRCWNAGTTPRAPGARPSTPSRSAT